MNCSGVRDRLVEHAMGLLSAEETAEVERHLEWCNGCRKESGEHQEALASLAFALPPSAPPQALEDRVVDRIARAAGTRRPIQRPRTRVLAATTLAAVLSTVGALGWAVAEHRRADDIRASVDQQVRRIEELRMFVDQFGGRQAELLPLDAGQATDTGTAIILPLDTQADWAFVEVVMSGHDAGPYTVRLLNRSGETRLSGQLVKSNNNTLVLLQRTGRNLLDVRSVAVLDGSGRKILGGTVRRAAAR